MEASERLDAEHVHSAAVAAGQALPMIGKLVGNTQVATPARYVYLADDPVKVAKCVSSARGEKRLGDFPPGFDCLAVRQSALSRCGP
jgi:hypothetical protein